MASTRVSTTRQVDSKASRRLLAFRLKKTPLSPFALRGMLRERFESKIKRNREILLERMRSSSEGEERFHDTLCTYLHDEMCEFQESKPPSHATDSSSFVDAEASFDIERELELMQQIENELVEEQLNWILEEYRKAEADQIFEDTPKLVCCPVCQGGFLNLAEEANLITCARCSMQLYSHLSLEQIETAVSHTLNEHVTYCDSNPQFAVINEPNSSGLFAICGACSLFSLLS